MKSHLPKDKARMMRRKLAIRTGFGFCIMSSWPGKGCLSQLTGRRTWSGWHYPRSPLFVEVLTALRKHHEKLYWRSQQIWKRIFILSWTKTNPLHKNTCRTWHTVNYSFPEVLKTVNNMALFHSEWTQDDMGEFLLVEVLVIRKTEWFLRKLC